MECDPSRVILRSMLSRIDAATEEIWNDTIYSQEGLEMSTSPLLLDAGLQSTILKRFIAANTGSHRFSFILIAAKVLGAQVLHDSGSMKGSH